MAQPLIVREQGASVMRFKTGASMFLGNTMIRFGQAIPTESASPGAVYFRSDGSASNFYINTSDGTTGSLWKSASVFTPA